MTIFKKALKIITVGALLLSTSAFSADFLINTSIDDSEDPGSGGWQYDIEKMDIQWASDDTITVDIYTNFVDYNNQYETYSRTRKRNGGWKYKDTGNIVLGDLLIGTNGADEAYNYAFVLSDADRDRSDYVSQSHWDSTGLLTEIGSTIDSDEYHLNAANISEGTVMAGDIIENDDQRTGNLDFDRVNAADGFDVISFSFNVNGIDAFQNATQLAFSWGMSCANDIVDGIVDINRPDGDTTNVPEPTTLLLFVLALGFMASSRNKQNN